MLAVRIQDQQVHAVLRPLDRRVIALCAAVYGRGGRRGHSGRRKGFSRWRDTPVTKRTQVLFKMKQLLDEHLDELTYLCAQENGKKWDEGMGDVLKVIEVVEFACGAPQMMKGESLMNVSTGYDTVQFREPLGVFAGIAPWNFPAMIPHGWMAPICIATGNCMVLKAASFAPQSAMRITELWKEAGLPDGVLNIVTTSRNEAEILLRHPDIKGVSFVGSTSVGQHIYSTAAANGKRVQALTEAKNHALVLKRRGHRARRAGHHQLLLRMRRRALHGAPVVVVENSVADQLVEAVVRLAKEVNLGPAYDKSTGLGPVVNQGHKDFVLGWIETAIKEGAKLILDGRNPKLPQECEKGFFVGPTIFDHVTEEMSCGREEIFGPVLCIKRVDSFEEGLQMMNNNRFRQRLGDLHRERPLRARVRAAHRRRHGRHQCRHSGSAWHLRIHRAQAVVLRRPALHGARRLHLLHRNQERHHPPGSPARGNPAKVSTWDGTMTRGRGPGGPRYSRPGGRRYSFMHCGSVTPVGD
jgi:acyl-CoA reductase-like NAD-dependent aldehyde dehydrogenase